MLSRNRLKFYTSLRNKKYRESHGQFLAEGEKIVTDILGFSKSYFKIVTLLANADFLQKTELKHLSPGIEVIQVSDNELKRISTLSSPNKAILVCLKPDYIPDYNEISEELSIYLENIRDPGNLGTIIRTADWFGISHLFCSRESVDAFNPKVIQSSMGAICKVRVYYEEPATVILNMKKAAGFKIFGTLLNGQNIFKENLPEKGLIVFGNESRGISPALVSELDVRLTIPSYYRNHEGSESLNISAAVSIVLAAFRKNAYSK